MLLKSSRRVVASSARAYSTPKIPDFDHVPAKYTGPSKEEIAALRKKHVHGNKFLLYKDPIYITEGKMQYLYDETGKRYLDLFGGICTVSVGHCHDEIVKAGQEQLGKLMHVSTIYHTEQMPIFAKELQDTLPEELDTVFFVNSGSEATDLAIMMARLHTKQHGIVAPRNAYHGMSAGAQEVTALSSWKFDSPKTFGIMHTQFPDQYRGIFAGDKDAGEKYAHDVEELVRYQTHGKLAGWISESVQGVGGTIPLPDGYLQRVYKTIKAAGGVTIADEVQTGFGRLGSHFWGFEKHGVRPDIVTMAKGIGNGAPLAAVVTTKEIAESMSGSGKLFFNTYGGNPVSMAIGRATLKAIQDEGLQEHSKKMGEYLIEKFHGLKKKHKNIGDIRGSGLMLGVEMVKDHDTKEPATAETLQVFEDCKDMGVLLGKGGLYGNVYRIKPPMCITKADCDFLVDVMDTALSKLN